MKIWLFQQLLIDYTISNIWLTKNLQVTLYKIRSQFYMYSSESYPDADEPIVVTVDDDDNNTDAYTNMVNYLSNNMWFYFTKL
jgi:hypothetical protein